MSEFFDMVLGFEGAILTAGAVFVRISALAFMIPGFGERLIPNRIKLGAALAFAAIVWPAVMPQAPVLTASLESLGYVYAAEATIGLVLGLSFRFLVFALQIAGTLVAQNLSITQAFGTGVAPDPEAVYGTIITLAAIALAMSFGLHVAIASILIQSYEVLPFGEFPLGSDMAAWSAARAGQAFSLAVSLATPFILVAFIYNLALGAINRAMPQMMVAFIGLPAINWLGLALMMLTAGAAIQIWADHFAAQLAAPLTIR